MVPSGIEFFSIWLKGCGFRLDSDVRPVQDNHSSLFSPTRTQPHGCFIHLPERPPSFGNITTSPLFPYSLVVILFPSLAIFICQSSMQTNMAKMQIGLLSGIMVNGDLKKGCFLGHHNHSGPYKGPTHCALAKQ